MSDETGVAEQQETYQGTGGALFLRSWRPAGVPRGVMVIVHGFNAHGGQYAWAAGQLAVARLAVYAPDLRGRGRSEGGALLCRAFR